MTTTTRTPPHHNNLTCYTNYACRLPACAERYRTNERDRRREHRQGTYQRFTDAALVQAHVQLLTATGAAPRAIALRANVSGRAVRDLLPTRPDGTRTPRRHRVLTATAAKLLALTPDDVVPQYVSALGSVRRLQALVADGLPMIHIAPHVNLFPSYVSHLLWRASENNDLQVRGATALAIRRGYEELRGKNPLRLGATRKSKGTARGIGASRNWPTSKYWDQFPGAIDDPHFEPMCGLTRREIVAQDANWVMRTSGLDKAATARRLGVDKSYVDHALRDHPEYALEVAA